MTTLANTRPSAVRLLTQPRAVEHFIANLLMSTSEDTRPKIVASVKMPRQDRRGDCAIWDIDSGFIRGRGTRGNPQPHFTQGIFTINVPVDNWSEEINTISSVHDVTGTPWLAGRPFNVVNIGRTQYGKPIPEVQRLKVDEGDAEREVTVSLAWQSFVKEAMAESRPMDDWERKVAADFLWAEFE